MEMEENQAQLCEASGDTAPDAGEQEDFEALIRGRYKEEFDAKVRKILDGRLRGLRQVVHTVEITESVGDQVPHVKLRRGRAGAQRVRAGVAEFVRVRLKTDAAGIQNDQKYSFH